MRLLPSVVAWTLPCSSRSRDRPCENSGVPVAAEVAVRIDAELDIVVVRKVGAPGSHELAIGGVTANGGRFDNEKSIWSILAPCLC